MEGGREEGPACMCVGNALVGKLEFLDTFCMNFYRSIHFTSVMFSVRRMYRVILIHTHDIHVHVHDTVHIFLVVMTR